MHKPGKSHRISNETVQQRKRAELRKLAALEGAVHALENDVSGVVDDLHDMAVLYTCSVDGVKKKLRQLQEQKQQQQQQQLSKKSHSP